MYNYGNNVMETCMHHITVAIPGFWLILGTLLLNNKTIYNITQTELLCENSEFEYSLISDLWLQECYMPPVSFCSLDW